MRFGWCLSIHGTMGRDLDMILIPWTEDAEHEDKVVDAIRLFVEGKMVQAARKRVEKRYKSSSKEGVEHFHVETKPHGRRAISLYIGQSGYYLDISIMPRGANASLDKYVGRA
jgi:hypothetical protein